MTGGTPSPRVGVFGGTFDPVHNGHLHVARELREALGLDRIVWVPAGRPPHKTGQIVSSDRDRLQMLRLALRESLGDEISSVDIDRSGPSYTADMLELLHDTMAPATLVFLMGEDSLRDFPTWRDPGRIIRAAELAVAARPGIDIDIESIAAQFPVVRGRVRVIPTTELAVSSSEIRERVRDAKSLYGLVPDSVANYIREHHLYLDRADNGTLIPAR
ncbi:MAG: nicotinate-nucleotide adenylyltransferase [Chloroflexota bacterium]|nr:nicotinate-nucleotide adenylyltransferase [Chloroflexota bacterium]